MTLLHKCLAAVLLAVSVASVAAEAPKQVIAKATDQMISRLEAEKVQIKDNPGKVEGIVRDVVLPEVDTASVARRVLGAHARTASPTQLDQFTKEFQEYLVRFYSRAFASYDGDKIEFVGDTEKDARGNAIVKTEIVRPNGQRIPVWYRLSPEGEGWKMYDVIVEGISLVQSKKEEFGPLINNKGLDGLISELAQVNAGAAK